MSSPEWRNMRITTDTPRREDQFTPGAIIISHDKLLTLFTADLCKAWNHRFCLELRQQKQRWALPPQGLWKPSLTLGEAFREHVGHSLCAVQEPRPLPLSMAGVTAPKAWLTHLSCPVRISPQWGMFRKVTWPSCWQKPRAGWEVAGDLWITRLYTPFPRIYNARGSNSSCSDFWWKVKEQQHWNLSPATATSGNWSRECKY